MAGSDDCRRGDNMSETVVAYLSALSDELTPVQRQAEVTILRPQLADLYQADRATFGLAATLVKIKLGIGRRDLEASLKPLLGNEAMNDSNPLPLAHFAALVDLVEDDGSVKFLVYDGATSAGVSLEEDYAIDGQVYVPPGKDFLPWLLPRAASVLAAYASDTPAQLYADLVRYYQNLSELPSEAHYDLLAAFTFHTYTLDYPDVTHSPQLVLDAVPERGKSRTGKAITHITMRGLRTETLREANIFRWSEDLRATLFFDVMNLWKKAEREKSEDLFLNRFEKGARAARVLNPDKGPFEDTRYFDIFGAPIIATNESVHKILDTRCLTISMLPTTKRFDTEPTPELGRPLRERLLAWRARHLGTPLPVMSKAFGGRFGDITLPLLQLVRLVMPAREPALHQLFVSMEQSRQNEKSRSIEGDILATMLMKASEVKNGKLALKTLVDKLNAQRIEREHVASRFTAARLRSLGFQLTGRNPADIVWNAELLNQCVVAYGIKTPASPPELSSQSCQSSQIPGEKAHGEESIETIERQNRAGRTTYQYENGLEGVAMF